MADTAKLIIGDQTYELPIVIGSEGERAVDITSLRQSSGFITLDPGYANTGSCKSAITFVNGEKGVLRYRGYPIEILAEQSSFIETAMLLLFGELPTSQERADFRTLLGEQEFLHTDLMHHFEGFPASGSPMAILSAVINSLGTFSPDLYEVVTPNRYRLAAAKLISKVRTIAAFSYRKSIGRPIIYPNTRFGYCHNFLHMMFSMPYQTFEPSFEAIDALELFLIVHADHEQNCSCSTVRMVGSSEANLFASVASGICALWGRLHGGANVGVVETLMRIQKGELTVPQCIEKVKKKELKLMGFGHRVYKSFDPRAKILKRAAHKLLAAMGHKHDPLLSIAQELEDAALNDQYFTDRKLYPNVDFYSGIILRALGIPVPMFPVMFAIGRLPGWIAHWYEEFRDPATRIHRPRQVYVGENVREYKAIENR